MSNQGYVDLTLAFLCITASLYGLFILLLMRRIKRLEDATLTLLQTVKHHCDLFQQSLTPAALMAWTLKQKMETK